MFCQDLLVLWIALLNVLIRLAGCLEYSETHYMSDGYGNVKFGYKVQTPETSVEFHQQERKPYLIYRPVIGFGGFRTFEYRRPMVALLTHIPQLPLIREAAASIPKVSRLTAREAKDTTAIVGKHTEEQPAKTTKKVPRYPIKDRDDQRTLYSHGHLYSDDPLAGLYVGPIIIYPKLL